MAILKDMATGVTGNNFSIDTVNAISCYTPYYSAAYNYYRYDQSDPYVSSYAYKNFLSTWTHEWYKNDFTVGVCAKMKWASGGAFDICAQLETGYADSISTWASLTIGSNSSVPAVNWIYNNWSPDYPMEERFNFPSVPDDRWIWLWLTSVADPADCILSSYMSENFYSLVSAGSPTVISNAIRTSNMTTPIRNTGLAFSCTNFNTVGETDPTLFFNSDVAQFCMYDRILAQDEMSEAMRYSLSTPPIVSVSGTMSPDISGTYYWVSEFDTARPIYVRNGSEYPNDSFLYKTTSGNWEFNDVPYSSSWTSDCVGPICGTYSPTGGSATGNPIVTQYTDA